MFAPSCSEHASKNHESFGTSFGFRLSAFFRSLFTLASIFNAAVCQFCPINSISEWIDWLITFLPLFYSPSTRFDRHSIQELFLGLFTVDPVQEDRLHAVQGPRASIQPQLRLTPPRATRLLYWYILSDIENYQKKVASIKD